MENTEHDFYQNNRRIMTYPKYSKVNITAILAFSWLPTEYNYLLMLLLASSFCSLNLQNKISFFNVS